MAPLAQEADCLTLTLTDLLTELVSLAQVITKTVVSAKLPVSKRPDSSLLVAVQLLAPPVELQYVAPVEYQVIDDEPLEDIDGGLAEMVMMIGVTQLLFGKL